MQTMQRLLPGLCCVLATAFAVDGPAQTTATPSYAYATNGVWDDEGQRRPGTRWKLLLDESNLGGKELEAAELILAAGTTTQSHAHGAVEIIYVLSGTYDHEVNGKLYRLTPGMVGIVRPGDKVRHLVPNDGDAKLLILWTPAGEAGRILSQAKGKALGPVPETQK